MMKTTIGGLIFLLATSNLSTSYGLSLRGGVLEQGERNLASKKYGHIQVKVNKIYVHNTGDDWGNYEEWRTTYNLALDTRPKISSSKKHNFDPREGRSAFYNVGISLDSGLFDLTQVQWVPLRSSGKFFSRPYRFKMYGYEDDSPDTHDPIPSCFSPYFDFVGSGELKNQEFTCHASKRAWTLYFDVIENEYRTGGSLCDDNPCHPREICEVVGESGFRCRPLPGPVDPCANNPCRPPKPICVPTGRNKYECLPDEENEPDPGPVNPCDNNVCRSPRPICVPIGRNDYECVRDDKPPADQVSWEEFQGLCRTAQNDSGIKGEDFTEHGNYDFTKCKDECERRNDCKAFEFVRDKKNCEIWHNYPPRVKSRPSSGYACWKKERDEWDKFQGVCRTADGRRGSDGNEYESFKDVSFDDCRKRCERRTDCEAFEHSGHNENCEIWLEYPAIRKGTESDDACWRKP